MPIINNSKYSRTYFAICARAKVRNKLDCQKEHHHILPKSLFPEFGSLKSNPWNGVFLTLREHFICHWLLTKMFDDSESTRKMNYALSCMYRKYKTGWRYERARYAVIQAMTGRQITEETRHNMSLAQRKRYLEGGRVNFKGQKHKPETLKLMSEMKKGPNHPFFGIKRPEHAVKISLALKNKPKSDDHKKKISETWQESRTRVKCKYCGILVTKSMHTRWHGDNCRTETSNAWI